MATSSAVQHTTELVSVKTLAARWDCSRTTVSRLLEDAGVEPVFLGKGRNGSKRYRKKDVDAFLKSLERL
jgi:DNA-binding transcriptional regulator YhcF (GntR family)